MHQIPCASGELYLDRFGRRQRHHFWNLVRIVPSLARVRPAEPVVAEPTSVQVASS